MTGPGWKEMGHTVQEGASAVEDIVHYNHHRASHELAVKGSACAVFQRHGVVQWGKFVHAEDAEHRLWSVDVAELGCDAFCQHPSLSFDGGHHDAVGAVVVFKDLSGNALNAAGNALGIQNDRFAGVAVGRGTHDAAISSFGAAFCTLDGSNSNNATASMCDVCGN